MSFSIVDEFRILVVQYLIAINIKTSKTATSPHDLNLRRPNRPELGLRASKGVSFIAIKFEVHPTPRSQCQQSLECDRNLHSWKLRKVDDLDASSHIPGTSYFELHFQAARLVGRKYMILQSWKLQRFLV